MSKAKPLLKELDSNACEEFIETLHNYAGDKLSSVVCGFDLRAPTCLYDMTGAEARTVIAFGAGARTKDGSTNANPNYLAMGGEGGVVARSDVVPVRLVHLSP
jgi:hypothetical protein